MSSNENSKINNKVTYGLSFLSLGMGFFGLFNFIRRGGIVIKYNPSLPPNSEEVILPTEKPISEYDIQIIKKTFSRPVVDMIINDRYLSDYNILVNRIGNYIKMAHNGHHLERVVILTCNGDDVSYGDTVGQDRAIEELRKEFSDIDIKIERSGVANHTRFITVTRPNGTKTMMTNHNGFNFINPRYQKGRVNQETLITVHEYFE